MPALLEVSAQNFKSLRDVTVRLGPLNVLVGPNGSGKSNLLDVVQFLGDAAREDLGPALERRRGYARVHFRGDAEGPIRISIKANVTSHSSGRASDEYALEFSSGTYQIRMRQPEGRPLPKVLQEVLSRSENFTFRHGQGRGRKITISGANVYVRRLSGGERRPYSEELLRADSLGLFTLPKLTTKQGGDAVRKVAELFSTFRVVDVDVATARKPARTPKPGLYFDPVEPLPSIAIPRMVLDASAGNLAAFLLQLSGDKVTFEQLEEDARAFVPGLKRIYFRGIGGADESVVVELEEVGLKGRTLLAEASLGTVRALSLLAVLYDPDPPLLTCIEEIDHGLHPYVFDRLVERLRWASKRTQFLIATHSPALVNRLNADELIVCERNLETGESIIPAADPEQIKAMERRAKGKLGLGELWFTGTLGGVPR